jgi:hypothetical protein
MRWEDFYKKYKVVATVWAPITFLVSVLETAIKLRNLGQNMSSEDIGAFVASVLTFFGILVWTVLVAAPGGFAFLASKGQPWKRKNYIMAAVAFTFFYVWSWKGPEEYRRSLFVMIGFAALVASIVILVIIGIIWVYRRLPT